MRGLRKWGAVVVLVLAACVPETPAMPPTRTILPEIAPSPTVNPVLPTINPFAQPGQNIPEAAVAPNDMGVDDVTPLPAEAGLEIVASRDGLRMRATLYEADVAPAPAVLLLHQAGGRKEDWLPLITPFQQAGFTVLAVDLRGFGVTGSIPNWTTARQDVLDILDYLRGVDGVDGGRIAVIGAREGANLALTACVVSTVCQAVVMLSPGLDYQGMTTDGAVTQLGERPLLLIAAEGDTYAARSARELDALATGLHDLMLFSGGATGTGLLTGEPGLAQTILAWVRGVQ
ncbi:MAG: hypothetical protein Kow0077_00250 [Anaerolineae bacterium]